MPKMGVDPETLNAPQPVDAGWYDLKIQGIEIKKSSKGDSFNYNFKTAIVNTNNPDLDGKKITVGLNTKMGTRFADMIHGAGFDDVDGVLNDNANWEFAKDDAENAEKAQYKGPLLGKVIRAEVVKSSYMGNESNKVKQITCKVKDCKVRFPKIRHSQDMIGKN